MSDWKCCAAERPEPDRDIVMRIKGAKTVLAFVLYLDDFDCYRRDGDETRFIQADVSEDLEWKYAEDL